MTTERAIRLLAGSLVLISLGLSLWVGPLGLLLAAFVGLNLVQSSFTGFCPAEKILEHFGLTSCGACGPAARVSSAAQPSRGQPGASPRESLS